MHVAQRAAAEHQAGRPAQAQFLGGFGAQALTLERTVGDRDREVGIDGNQPFAVFTRKSGPVVENEYGRVVRPRRSHDLPLEAADRVRERAGFRVADRNRENVRGVRALARQILDLVERERAQRPRGGPEHVLDVGVLVQRRRAEQGG